MTLDLSHLTAATRELAFHDAKARILLVQTARWVAYPRAGIAVEELERRFHYPSCARMPCMLLYGDSGMGKSMILEKMERQHPSTYDERKGITTSDDSTRGSWRSWERPTPCATRLARSRDGSFIC
jgi:putative ribosome biogenesis GTPase RsgA